MEKEENPIYERNTLEFVTVALEYCTFVEAAGNTGLFDFVDKATKLLPLLYLKASLLPEVESEEETELELSVSEDMYESVRSRIAGLLGERDSYLETFHADMRYSDTPIAAFISENLADVYQDTGNFVSLFRQGNEEVMQEAIALCRTNFQEYWGQQLLNALKALHAMRYSGDEDLEKNEDKEWAVFYVPENLQGETQTQGGNKSDAAPSNALVVDITTEIGGERYLYAAYPGGNSLNNFNIQRNQVYRITVTITGEKNQNNPSANCFVVKPDGFLSFEPYYRVETGGGYNFADYLSPHDENLKIARVGIIWQTKDCIGDNTNGTQVQLGENTGDIHQKIYVRTQKKGNALIGAYNSEGDIIWSWHIWVTDDEPDNLGRAVTYYTYDWDQNGIYPEKPRIQGYAVMSCNLGALAENQEGTGNGLHRYPDPMTQAFGMLYQWGR